MSEVMTNIVSYPYEMAAYWVVTRASATTDARSTLHSQRLLKSNRAASAIKEYFVETSTIWLGHFSAKSRLCGSEHMTKLLTSLKVVANRDN